MVQPKKTRLRGKGNAKVKGEFLNLKSEFGIPNVERSPKSECRNEFSTPSEKVRVNARTNR
jgi:hypothetical protein